MYIESLHFSNVGPFDEADFTFDPNVNVFTGPNNAGKSTALLVLGDILVYPFAFPSKLIRTGAKAEFTIRFGGPAATEVTGELPISQDFVPPGDEEAAYWTLERWNSHIPDVLSKVGYSTLIPALRRSTDFRSRGPTAESISNDEQMSPTAVNGQERRRIRTPRDVSGARARLRDVQNPELRKRLALVETNASLISDEAVIQKIIELDYRSYLRDNPALRSIIDKIGQVATEITEGFPIEFTKVVEDESGFFPTFDTIDGPMPLNTLSQGTQSIIQWLAHFLIGYAEYYDFPSDFNDKPGVLIIDEIDAHLHPSWQQRIIPTLTKHFPCLQIFCSTHSPLMLGGLLGGQVQLLHRGPENNIIVSRNDDAIVGWSADEILRYYLNVSNPTDLGMQRDLQKLADLRSRSDLSPDEAEELDSLRKSVGRDLLGGPVSDLIKEFADDLRNVDSGTTLP